MSAPNFTKEEASKVVVEIKKLKNTIPKISENELSKMINSLLSSANLVTEGIAIAELITENGSALSKHL